MAGLTTLARVAKANRAYSDEIRRMLDEGYRTVVEQTVKMTFIELVKATWQDSSNAASNWQALANIGNKRSYRHNVGLSPVGSHGEHRSREGKELDIQLVAAKTLLGYSKFITKALNTGKAVNFKFYNPISSPEYIANADLWGAEYAPNVIATKERVSAKHFAQWQAKYKF